MTGLAHHSLVYVVGNNFMMHRLNVKLNTAICLYFEQFNFLLIKTKGATTSGSPIIIRGETEAADLEKFMDTCLVDPFFFERQLYNEVFMFGIVCIAEFFISSDCDIAVHGYFCLQQGLDPLFKG